MKLFKCQNCGQVLFFENRVCGRCGHQLGFLPKQGDLSALTPDGAEWRRSPPPAPPGASAPTPSTTSATG